MTATRFLLAGSLVLAACSSSAILGDPTPSPGGDDDDAVADDDDAVNNDADGDGDPAETDCDDDDPEVASTFDEVCGDGKDNDCDEETRCYSLRRDDAVHWIEPVAGAEDADEWYGYGESAGGSHGFDIANTLVTLLYRDGFDDLWLVVSVDGWDDDSGGSVAVDVGDVGDADIEVSDDEGEVYWVGEEIWLDFRWAGCCVDGAVIGPLDDDFCLVMDVLSGHSGLGGGLVAFDGTSPIDVGRAEGRAELCVED